MRLGVSNRGVAWRQLGSGNHRRERIGDVVPRVFDDFSWELSGCGAAHAVLSAFMTWPGACASRRVARQRRREDQGQSLEKIAARRSRVFRMAGHSARL